MICEDFRPLLERVKVPRNLRGYQYLPYAMHLRRTQPDGQLTKWLYPEVAQHFGTTWKNVERNIRSAISASWDRGGKEELESLASFPLTQKPSAGTFMAILISAYAREYGQP